MFFITTNLGNPTQRQHRRTTTTYTWECTIVPKITLVWEAVAHKAELALLDVLFDGVQEFLLANLQINRLVSTRLWASLVKHQSRMRGIGHGRTTTYLKFCVSPTRDLNNHVQDGLLLIGIKGNVVEWRDGDAILFDIRAKLKSVGLADLADGVLRFA